MTAPSLRSIPKGNTCHGVHRAVVDHLVGGGRNLASARLLDLPCGDGTLVKTLREFFPGAQVRGADLHLPAVPLPGLSRVDASRPFSIPGGKFDAITCVSGVMEFDNTRQFFESCRLHLASNGRLIVTNDNLVSVRDRLAYFACGKTRQFELYGTPDRPRWKVIPLQNLLRILHDAGFAVRAIQYVPIRAKDWLLLPLAAALWPGQWLHTRFARGRMPQAERRTLFPFSALLSRHYLVVCEPAEAPSS